ncbi:MAG: 4'-phosphopantetheinyl transferase superfamily protein [Pseudomonadota bacterium]
MPLPKAHALGKNEVSLYVLRHDAVPDTKLRQLRRTLSDHELQRNQRYANERMRRCDLVCRGTLRRLLAGVLQRPPEALELIEGERGKPLLAAGDLFFNYSHSGDYAAFALCWDAQVGVDIECERPLANPLAIARRQFAKNEYKALTQTPDADLQSRFFKYWTLKEAFLKARGDGISGGMDTFSLEIVSDPPRIDLAFKDGSAEIAADWALHSARPIAGYWLALAIHTQGKRYAIVNNPCGSQD